MAFNQRHSNGGTRGYGQQERDTMGYVYIIIIIIITIIIIVIIIITLYYLLLFIIVVIIIIVIIISTIITTITIFFLIVIYSIYQRNSELKPAGVVQTWMFNEPKIRDVTPMSSG